MNSLSNFWHLENVDLHKLFCVVEMGNMGHHPESKVLKRGDFIYFPEDKANKVFLLQEGRVKIGAYSEEGKEIIKAVLHKGELFGELGLIGQENREEFAQAMETTTVCMMPVEAIRELMQKNQNFSLKITQLIGSKLIKTQRRLESLIFKDARSRIIEFLYDLAYQKGQRIGYEQLVRDFFTHQEIANLTGTSRQTVTTILNELREKNMIYFDRRKLLVRDMDELKALI